MNMDHHPAMDLIAPASISGPASAEDTLALRAAEEFVASGRSVEAERAAHRRRAFVFVALLRELRRGKAPE
jgi:hypothetical protein